MDAGWLSIFILVWQLLGAIAASGFSDPGEKLLGASGATRSDVGGVGASSTLAGEGPAGRILGAQRGPLRDLLAEVLARSPVVARLQAEAHAARARAARAGALPDPTAGLVTYLSPPETRVGAQRGVLTLAQRLPWFGKLALKERGALLATTAARAQVEESRLQVLTRARRLYLELAFLDTLAAVTRTDLVTLQHYEELARARYRSGVGLEQGVIKLQAEITRDETKLLRIAVDRDAVAAELNALRDRPHTTVIPELELPRLGALSLERPTLRARALASRPALWATAARIEEARTGVELARKSSKPDFNLSLTYGVVGRRDDAAGRRSPPADDGQDVLGVAATINVPLWRSRLAAEVEEATHGVLAAEETERQVVVEIDQALTRLLSRLDLLWRQLRLYEDVLAIQAEASLSSAEGAYSAGSLNALELLDAERVLLEVRVATARTRADYAVALAELEGVVAVPLNGLEVQGGALE